MAIRRVLFCFAFVSCAVFIPFGNLDARTGEEAMKVDVGAGFAVGLYGERIDPKNIDKEGYVSLRVLWGFVRPELEVDLDNGFIASVKTKIYTRTSGDDYNTLSLKLRDAFLALEGPFGKVQVGSVYSVNNKLHVSTPWASPFSGVDYAYYSVVGPSFRNLILVPDRSITNEATAKTNLDAINKLLSFDTYPDLTGSAIKINVYTPRFAWEDFVGVAIAMSYTPNAKNIMNVLGANISVDGNYDLSDIMSMMEGSMDMGEIANIICPDKMISYRVGGGYEISIALPFNIERTDQVGDVGLSFSVCGLTLGGGAKYRVTSNDTSSSDTTVTWSTGFSYGRDDWKAGFGFLQALYLSGSTDASVSSTYATPIFNPSRARNHVDFTASYELSEGLTITGNLQYVWYTENSSRVADAVGAGVILGFLY